MQTPKGLIAGLVGAALVAGPVAGYAFAQTPTASAPVVASVAAPSAPPTAKSTKFRNVKVDKILVNGKEPSKEQLLNAWKTNPASVGFVGGELDGTTGDQLPPDVTAWVNQGGQHYTMRAGSDARAKAAS